MPLAWLFFGGGGICARIMSFQCGADVVFQAWLTGLLYTFNQLILNEFFPKKKLKALLRLLSQ